MTADPDRRGSGEEDAWASPSAHPLHDVLDRLRQQLESHDIEEQPNSEKLRGEKRLPAEHLDAGDRAPVLLAAAAEIVDLTADPAMRIGSVVDLTPIVLGHVRRPTEARPLDDVAHRLTHVGEREGRGGEEIAIDLIGGAGEPGLPPCALHAEGFDDAAIVFGDPLPVVPI